MNKNYGCHFRLFNNPTLFEDELLIWKAKSILKTQYRKEEMKSSDDLKTFKKTKLKELNKLLLRVKNTPLNEKERKHIQGLIDELKQEKLFEIEQTYSENLRKLNRTCGI